jgi:hypothetical protein
MGRGTSHASVYQGWGAVPEIIEAVALAMIEEGAQGYKTCGREVIEAAEKMAAELV